MVLKELIFCLFLIHVNGEIASSDGSVFRFRFCYMFCGSNGVVTEYPCTFNEDDELAKIRDHPITNAEHKKLSGGVFRRETARMKNGILLRAAIETIAFSELRSVLCFGPLGKPKRPQYQSEKTYSNIEEYYETKETSTWTVQDCDHIDELIPFYVKFLDERFPEVRKIFKGRFYQARHASQSEVGEKTVDFMINTHQGIMEKVLRPFDVMRHFTRCSDPLYEGDSGYPVNWKYSNETRATPLNLEEDLPEVLQCLTEQDLSWGNESKFIYSPRSLPYETLSVSLESIGLSEFRSVLHMAPPHRWNEWTEQQQITPSMSIKEYVEATEPRSFFRSKKRSGLTDTFVSTAIAFMEQRYPGLRGFFHRKFQGIVEQAGKNIDRKTIDQMNETFVVIVTKLQDVVIERWFNC